MSTNQDMNGENTINGPLLKPFNCKAQINLNANQSCNTKEIIEIALGKGGGCRKQCRYTVGFMPQSNVKDNIYKPRKASQKIGEVSKMSKVDAENNDMSDQNIVW